MSTPMTGFAAEPMGPAEIFFGFTGRISRRTWWLYGVIAPAGLSIIFVTLLRIAGFTFDGATGIASLVLLWPLLATSAKRWHDINRSGWWALVTIPPVIGWIAALVFNGLLPGTKGRNRFGDDPLNTVP